MTPKKAFALAEEYGFSHWGTIAADQLVLRSEIRDICADGKCGKYDKCWSCPPACGTLEEISEKIAGFRWGLLLQMTGQMEDEFDFEAILETERKLKKCFYKLSDRLRADGEELFAMSAGACTICDTCTYPNHPCRFPEKLFPSMEACGLVVLDICTKAGLGYNYGKNTITFTGCILFQ